MGSAKILVLDIETAPLLAYVWGLWENNVALNQIHSDWYVLSWCAKWFDSDEILYMDQRNAPDIENDRETLNGIWNLLNEADVIITQNGKKFDAKKLNARFVIQGFQPPSSYKHVDTLQIAKKHFAFTSNKLEYMAEKLNVKFKKLQHENFPGFELWSECIKGNRAAWDEMEKYNKHDVLALEELFKKLIPWDNSYNPNLYHDETHTVCTCGSTMFNKWGFRYSPTGKFQRYKCRNCGSEFIDKENLFDSMKKLTLKKMSAR